MMKTGRFLILSLGAVLAATVLLAACGGDDEAQPSATVRAPSDSTGMNMGGASSSHANQAMEKMDLMVAAAKAGKMKDAEQSLESADEHLHAVINELKTKNAKLATELDEAVEDAEKDMKAGEKPDHIVEAGEAIMVLLKKAQ